MCESKVILRSGDVETVIMDEAARVESGPNGVTISGILGQKKEVKGTRIVLADLTGHRIILEKD